MCACKQCQHLRPSLPNDVEINTTASKPMEKVSVDLFEIKYKHYILLVDRFSVLPWFKAIQNLSSESVTKYLLEIFKNSVTPEQFDPMAAPNFKVISRHSVTTLGSGCHTASFFVSYWWFQNDLKVA